MATIIVKNNASEVSAELGKLIKELAAKSSSTGYFTVGLSGGSMIKLLSDALSNLSIDFLQWRLFFCDERLVPKEDAESTFGAYLKEFQGKISIAPEQFVPIRFDASAEIAAESYAKQIEEYFPHSNVPQFDILLLGLGPDGHTCSLFPDHPLLDENQKLIASITNSPKPPPSRITFTFPLINNAKTCVFAVTGTEKADMVKRIVKDKEQLPAAMVQPKHGKLYWILDTAAAAKLL